MRVYLSGVMCLLAIYMTQEVFLLIVHWPVKTGSPLSLIPAQTLSLNSATTCVNIIVK